MDDVPAVAERTNAVIPEDTRARRIHIWKRIKSRDVSIGDGNVGEWAGILQHTVEENRKHCKADEQRNARETDWLALRKTIQSTTAMIEDLNQQNTSDVDSKNNIRTSSRIMEQPSRSTVFHSIADREVPTISTLPGPSRPSTKITTSKKTKKLKKVQMKRVSGGFVAKRPSSNVDHDPAVSEKVLNPSDHGESESEWS